ncbi:Phosphodiest-domain-containing protein [Mycena floridula]|nr:Phosphodiest-domain-containing protein [Mycena floridula]
MASSSRGPFSKSDREERKGLLSDTISFPDHDDDDHELGLDLTSNQRSGWSSNRIIITAVAFILLLICGTFARTFLISSATHPNLLFHGNDLRSNGTHEFKRTVLIVSIDGLRADYLDRGLTPHLLDISKQGLRAKSMIPVFPTLTFPNHWALMTGLYAESHGIVANNFWDPVSKSEFHYNKVETCWNPTWWLGEPMWETAGKANIITANLMWPGPPKTMSGATATYFIPWKNKVPMTSKLNQIMEWIDMPNIDERPQLIMAYEPSLDQAGHKAGPNSLLVNQTLAQVDYFAKSLHTELERRNLSDIVDIVFVSDHGMTDTSAPELVYMDDFIGEDGLREIEHEDGWPAMGLRFRVTANSSHLLELLLDASDKNPEKFDVYTHETMPERYHFSNNERIAPVYVVPKIGYVLTTKAQGNVGLTKGSHGYDNAELGMHAMFVAHGPFSSVVKALHQNSKRSFLSRPNLGWHSTMDDVYVMDRFENIQIYGLVMKLLGVQAAPTNGTTDFWDKYF